MAGAIIAAGLRLVAKVSLVYIWLAFIIVIYVLQSAKVQRFFETTKCLVDFLRNVEIMVLVEVYGQIMQKQIGQNGQKQIGQIAFADV